jgi:hypothetical protein
MWMNLHTNRAREVPDFIGQDIYRLEILHYMLTLRTIEKFQISQMINNPVPAD